MFGAKKPKQDVTIYGMSIHFGVCTGPVDYMSGLIVDGKDARDSRSPPVLSGPTEQPLYLPDLFGGEKKEGGLGGMIQWLPGRDDQVMPENLAAKFGRTSATMPAYRGISSIFFWGIPPSSDARSPFDGFYWRANTPYLPGVWVEVARASTQLDEAHARIYRDLSSTARQDASLDLSVVGFGNRSWMWDTAGSHFAWGSGGTGSPVVYDLPGGESRTIATTAEAGAIHLSDADELFTINGG